jgi:3-oxoacyl-[acyl-carrier protein] reductase
MILKDKKILITGATGGIGYSLVKKFNELDAKIIASGTNEEKLSNLLKEFPKIDVVKFKLEEHGKIEGFIDQTFKKLDGIDVLINNAGITLDNLSIRLTDEDWKKVLDINLTSSFLMCKHVIKKMLKKKYGKIINISSQGGRKPRGLGDIHRGNVQTPYLVSKAAVIQYTHLLAIELGRYNINVNAVCPGVIWTPIWRQIAENHIEQNPNLKKMTPKEVFEELAVKARTPLGRGQTPEDIGKTVAAGSGIALASLLLALNMPSKPAAGNEVLLGRFS